MKIALTVDPEIAVPPLHYGGIERIVDFLVSEYQKLGHEVYLFANEHSRQDCNLKVWPGKTSTSQKDTIKNMLYLTKQYMHYRFDIVHSFSRLAYLSLILPLGAKCIMSYQREPTISQIQKAQRLAFWANLCFTGCSNYISQQIAPHAKAYTVYNGIDLNKFQFNPSVEKDAPLVFLGRIEPIKGTHNAIQLAKASNKKLVIAGNIPAEYQWYFDQEIKPQLNEQIVYIGPVNDEQKNKLLRQALAFLMLIEWNEPFGIVMAEAMACGTPVIGTPCGAVNEVLVDGENGFLGNSIQEWINKTQAIHQISREKTRIYTEKNFSSEAISFAYLNIYNTLRGNDKK